MFARASAHRVAPAILAALLVACGAASGAIAAREDVVVNPSAAVFVTLVAGATGSTALGTSATSATTTHSGSIVVAHEVLKAHKVSGNWDVSITLLSATGFGAADSATIKETLGASTQTQAVVALGGTITQSSGTPLTLTSTSSDISVTVVGTKVSVGASVLTMQFTILPSGAATPIVTYNYVLTLT